MRSSHFVLGLLIIAAVVAAGNWVSSVSRRRSKLESNDFNDVTCVPSETKASAERAVQTFCIPMEEHEPDDAWLQAVDVGRSISLSTDVYFPSEYFSKEDNQMKRFPVLLVRTPYDKTKPIWGDKKQVGNVLQTLVDEVTAAGYVFAIQDVRGRFASPGTFVKYVNEGWDGYDTIEWLAAQEWCTGDVATFGTSYLAHVQMAAACRSPPHLRAMFLDSGGFHDSFQGGIRYGGAFELKQLTWAWEKARDSSTDKDAQAILGDPSGLWKWFEPARMPWRQGKGNNPLAFTPMYESYVLDMWHTFANLGPYWKQIGLYAKGYKARIPNIPILLMTGWFDPYVATTISNFEMLSSRNKKTLDDRKVPHVQMILGPWTHGASSSSTAGNVDFGSVATLGPNVAPAISTLALIWFRFWLPAKRGDASKVQISTNPITYFTMGAPPRKFDPPFKAQGIKAPSKDKATQSKSHDHSIAHCGSWASSATWPPSQTENGATAYYLDASKEDRAYVLTRIEPSRDASVSYDYDPLHPCPTVGGQITSAQPVMYGGSFDQSTGPKFFPSELPYGPLAARSDVLVFQTEDLEAEVDIAGPVEVVLHVSSSALDTDFTFKLIDVFPPAESTSPRVAINLANAILRMRYRDSYEKPTVLSPGERYTITLRSPPVAARFAKGHRIRLDISSSNYPFYDTNPNTAVELLNSTQVAAWANGYVRQHVVAHNTVHTGSAGSVLRLPVVASNVD